MNNKFYINEYTSQSTPSNVQAADLPGVEQRSLLLILKAWI
jgi:hypothetical protein